MNEAPRPHFSFVVRDNELAAARSFEAGHNLQAFPLLHTLIESLRRVYLAKLDSDESFSHLNRAYRERLIEEGQPPSDLPFLSDLEQISRYRNRVVHDLWSKGFSHINQHAEPVVRDTIRFYGLFIEWLETFDPEITSLGYNYHVPDGA